MLGWTWLTRAVECMCSHWSKIARSNFCLSVCICPSFEKIQRHYNIYVKLYRYKMLTVHVAVTVDGRKKTFWQKGLSYSHIVCVIVCYWSHCSTLSCHHLIVINGFLSFPSSQVTGERYCRAQQEAHHASDTYLCLLASTRNHLVLHNLYHGKGELNQEEAAGLVGLRLPTQPGGKGWEKWGHGRMQRWKRNLTCFRNDLCVADLVSYNLPHGKIWLESGRLDWRLCHHGLLWGNSTYSCCVQWSRGGNLIWEYLKQMWKYNLCFDCFSCKYTVLYRCSTPAFVCVLAILNVIWQKQPLRRTVSFHFDSFFPIKILVTVTLFWDFLKNLVTHYNTLMNILLAYKLNWHLSTPFTCS